MPELLAPGVGMLGVLKLLVIMGELRNKSFHSSSWCYFCYFYSYGWFENDELLWMMPGVNENIPGENVYPKLKVKLNWLSLSWSWCSLYWLYLILLFYFMLLLVYFFRKFNLRNACEVFCLFCYLRLYFLYTYLFSDTSFALSLLYR